MNDANTIFGITANGGRGIGDQIPDGSNGSEDSTFGPGTSTYAVDYSFDLDDWVEISKTISSEGFMTTFLTTTVVGCRRTVGIVRVVASESVDGELTIAGGEKREPLF